MATKSAPLVVELPKNLATAIKSRVDPNRESDRGTQISQDPAYPILNQTARTFRQSANITELLRHLARVEGPLSSAIHSMVEISASNRTVIAYNAKDHTVSAEGTSLAMSVLSNMDVPTDYKGAAKKKSVDSTIKVMLKEALLTGMVAAELGLNKSRLPDRIQVVGAETLVWQDDGDNGVIPAQAVAGENDPISLDIPTFFYDHLNPDPGTITPRSMMEACLKMLVYFEEFMEDIRRSVRVSGHNRLKFVIDTQKVAETAPRDVKNDPVKLRDYLSSVRSAVETQLANITPEQALVMFDSVDAETLESGHGTKQDYTPLLNVVVGQYATSMKTPPSVLGLRLEGGSSQMGSVETLIFLKSVKALHTPVETVMSRILTLACRLYGADVYCWYRFDPLDMRPERELEAFMTMRESRILDRLSLGLISDDEAAIELGVFPRPPNAPILSGTMFRQKGNDMETHPGDTPLGRDLQPDKDAPRKAGGRSQ